MVEFEFLHPEMSRERLGYLPSFLSEQDSLSAKEQFAKNYAFGGWRPRTGFKLEQNNSLHYPGDPPLAPLAQYRLRDELIVFYDYAWVAVIQPNRNFEVSRLD